MDYDQTANVPGEYISGFGKEHDDAEAFVLEDEKT
jgi:hypothetical protein